MALAIGFEGGSIVVAFALGWLTEVWPVVGVSWEREDWPRQGMMILAGIAATGPMLLGLVGIRWLRWRALARLWEVVDELLVPLFRGSSIFQLALISLLAGVGEELLFRGVLQTGLAQWIGGSFGPAAALAVASILFGLAHYITGTYALLATLTGLYLGGLLLVSGNIFVPMVAHGLYDFVALIYLCRWRSTASGENSQRF